MHSAPSDVSVQSPPEDAAPPSLARSRPSSPILAKMSFFEHARDRQFGAGERHAGSTPLALVLTLMLTLTFVPRLSRAQSSYRAVPMGGRTALMGNTGITFSRDGSAPFLNPATIVWIRDTRIAFSLAILAGTDSQLQTGPRTKNRRRRAHGKAADRACHAALRAK